MYVSVMISIMAFFSKIHFIVFYVVLSACIENGDF